jgi:hypothetical protein
VDFGVCDMGAISSISFVYTTRDTRERWPLLTVGTEVNGDSKSTNERDTSLVCSFGVSCRYKRLSSCTVRKMDLILRSIQRRPQMQFSMARRFKLQLLRRYSVKFSKMRNFTLGSP